MQDALIESRRILNPEKGRLIVLEPSIEGKFSKGDNVLILDDGGKALARGLTSYSSIEIDKIKGLKTDQIESILGYFSKSEIIHRDDMVKL